MVRGGYITFPTIMFHGFDRPKDVHEDQCYRIIYSMDSVMVWDVPVTTC